MQLSVLLSALVSSVILAAALPVPGANLNCFCEPEGFDHFSIRETMASQLPLGYDQPVKKYQLSTGLDDYDQPDKRRQLRMGFDDYDRLLMREIMAFQHQLDYDQRDKKRRLWAGR
ncbi:uncharacterized protein BJ212DRAFT_1479684 [Suillus subaureus]|uniref:Uncharacterized protein n=1 Tax=Suillus subaureus TaxID=48587 RepID=A0A9P7EES0_9AGAM|nr:uncharacterized protein BJ212DRAFT_1479684 [Suillus subaureus]KAG1818698.1 hypothetical protein BJ212DRAFT_1479684 [Suillus subaureus]